VSVDGRHVLNDRSPCDVCRFIVAMTSSSGTRCLLTVVVVSVVVAVVDSEDDRTLTSPLFDVGRLWVQASVRQASRMLAVLPPTSAIATLLFAAVSLFAVHRLYLFLFLPIDRIKLLGDVGYIVDGRQSMNDVAEQVKRRRVVGDVPPVYPNGWFALVESRCLKVGQVKNVCCLGKTSSCLLIRASRVCDELVILDGNWTVKCCIPCAVNLEQFAIISLYLRAFRGRLKT